MDARIDLLIRQQSEAADLLQVFLVSAGRQEAFVLPLPAELEQLQQLWRTRFLRHHDPAFAWPEGAAVVRSYSERLAQGLQQWLQQPAWQPLQQILSQLPSAPLTVRLDGVSETLRALPWENLELQRPIWRHDGQAAAGLPAGPARVRKPRILLLVGSETGLTLDGEIEQLQHLQRSGRIRLTLLRGVRFTSAALRSALTAPTGWDAVLYLGHSDSGPKGGLLHLGDGSQLDGQALEATWAEAARKGLRLLLLNSCSGLQLAHHAARAGIDWAVCFVEPVPASAGAAAFGHLLQALDQGCDLLAATDQTRQFLASSDGFEGCHLLLAVVASPAAGRFYLPLSRGRQLVLRLAQSSRRQAIAAGVCTAAALVMELTPWNPLNTYLLDRRLELQRGWRQLIHQPGPVPSAQHPPIPVLLLDPTTTTSLGVASRSDHTSRLALAAVLQRTPPAQVPLVGLDVLFDQDRPGTSQLAALLRAQSGRRVVGGELSPFSDPNQQMGSNDWLGGSSLVAAGMQVADLAVGTAAGYGGLKPVPLVTQASITSANFAGALARGKSSLLPADRIIDWSLNWADQVQLVQLADLPSLRAPLLLVGTIGRLANGPGDLFRAPATVQNALLRGDQPLWKGNAREVPGVLVQAVLIQSLNRGHWLTPLSLTLCTISTAALGVMLAALIEQRQHRLIALVLISVASCPLAFTLAVMQLWLLPLLLPLLALSATTFSRDD